MRSVICAVLVCLSLLSCALQPGVDQLVDSARAKCRRGLFDQARKEINTALDRCEAVSREERRTCQRMLLTLAEDLEIEANKLNLSRPGQRHPNSESLYGIVLSIRDRLQDPLHTSKTAALTLLAAAAMDRRDYASAEPLLRRLIAVRAKQGVSKDVELNFARGQLGILCEQQGRFEEAKELYRRVLAWHDLPPPSPPSVRAAALYHVARFYRSVGRGKEATELGKKADRILAAERAAKTGRH